MLFVMQEQSRYIHVSLQQRNWQQQCPVLLFVWLRVKEY